MRSWGLAGQRSLSSLSTPAARDEVGTGNRPCRENKTPLLHRARALLSATPPDWRRSFSSAENSPPSWAQLGFAPCWKSGRFWLVCLFFWRNFESQANTLILTFLQPWPIFTACQQRTLARSHLSLSAVTLSPAPSAPLPRIRGEQSLRRKHH